MKYLANSFAINPLLRYAAKDLLKSNSIEKTAILLEINSHTFRHNITLRDNGMEAWYQKFGTQDREYYDQLIKEYDLLKSENEKTEFVKKHFDRTLLYRRKSNSKLNSSVINEVKEMRENGITVNEICTKLNLTYNEAYYILNKENRSRKKDQEPHPSLFDKPQEKDLVASDNLTTKFQEEINSKLFGLQMQIDILTKQVRSLMNGN